MRHKHSSNAREGGQRGGGGGERVLWVGQLTVPQKVLSPSWVVRLARPKSVMRTSVSSIGSTSKMFSGLRSLGGHIEKGVRREGHKMRITKHMTGLAGWVDGCVDGRGEENSGFVGGDGWQTCG